MISVDQSVRKFAIEMDEFNFGASPRFFIDAEQRFPFYICVLPFGCYLRSKCKTATIHLKYCLWLNNAAASEAKVISETYRNRCDCGSGMESYMQESYIKDGVITVYCQIKSASILTKRSFLGEISIYSQKPELYDCTIKVEGKHFPASKYVMGLHSDVFAALWSADMKETKTNEIEIQDFDAKTVERMLNFIHSFGLNYPPEASEAASLYEIAEKYQIFPLKEKCTKTMIEALSKRYLCKYLILAVKYSIEELEDATVEFARNNENMTMLLESDDFIDLGRKDFELFLKIMRAISSRC